MKGERFNSHSSWHLKYFPVYVALSSHEAAGGSVACSFKASVTGKKREKRWSPFRLSHLHPCRLDMWRTVSWLDKKCSHFYISVLLHSWRSSGVGAVDHVFTRPQEFGLDSWDFADRCNFRRHEWPLGQRWVFLFVSMCWCIRCQP